MKRYAIPALAGVLVFGAVTGFAASLDVGTKSLGSGVAGVGVCTTSAAPATVSYATAWDATDSRYEVTNATVTAPAACAGMDYRVTITNAADESLGEANGVLVAGATPATDPATAVGAITGTASATDVVNVTVVITG